MQGQASPDLAVSLVCGLAGCSMSGDEPSGDNPPSSYRLQFPMLHHRAFLRGPLLISPQAFSPSPQAFCPQASSRSPPRCSFERTGGSSSSRREVSQPPSPPAFVPSHIAPDQRAIACGPLCELPYWCHASVGGTFLGVEGVPRVRITVRQSNPDQRVPADRQEPAPQGRRRRGSYRGKEVCISRTAQADSANAEQRVRNVGNGARYGRRREHRRGDEREDG
ncbi:uncharacterized protein B0H18DRAFT_424351 [Fomitopsis serialis]|uniref:uncharacterized protein n=1 Tax=Fomitopsis serialis TaxID=139415 RepID=UPI002008681B|nr:uncharacterized protein B0H18DRAFT_424351 [Neoantrodia serialis]KAH9924509.1 hypothetical protein B0H18DRAFT_424351 [Neoantrodia serialis]